MGDVYAGKVAKRPLADRMKVALFWRPGWEGMVYANPPHRGFLPGRGPESYADDDDVFVQARACGCASRLRSVGEVAPAVSGGAAARWVQVKSMAPGGKGFILAVVEGPAACPRGLTA